MPPPFLVAKTLILGPGKKIVLLLLDCPVPPESSAGVGVLLHMGIQMVEVNREVQASVLLSDQHYHITLHTLTGSYGAQF